MIAEISSLSGASSTAKKPTELGQTDFLNLLVTQLTNQNPLEPMDSTAFVTQLAQFSELEEVQKVALGIGEVQNYLASVNNFSAVSLLGREIEFSGDVVHYESESQPEIAFKLGKEASKVTVNLYDRIGNVVRTWTMGDVEAGRQKLIWNGADQNGNFVEPGDYRFEVTAQGVDGSSVPVELVQQGTVDKVDFVNGLPYLYVGDQRIALADIQSITNQ
jgi:flagellar basal-body rod modification protein FlgD